MVATDNSPNPSPPKKKNEKHDLSLSTPSHLRVLDLQSGTHAFKRKQYYLPPWPIHDIRSNVRRENRTYYLEKVYYQPILEILNLNNQINNLMSEQYHINDLLNNKATKVVDYN